MNDYENHRKLPWVVYDKSLPYWHATVETYAMLLIFQFSCNMLQKLRFIFHVVWALYHELINALDKWDAFMKLYFVVKNSIYFGGKLQRRLYLEENNMLNISNTFSDYLAWGFTVQFHLKPLFWDSNGRNFRNTNELLQTCVKWRFIVFSKWLHLFFYWFQVSWSPS